MVIRRSVVQAVTVLRLNFCTASALVRVVRHSYISVRVVDHHVEAPT